jgi:4-diphosphocytidyl-2-C-methyl-D-erythritol kinase
MVFFPNCKINLGLRILRRREDGYHDLETVFYPLPLKDALEIIPSEELRFTAAGITIPGEAADNLCLKAWHLLKKDFPDLPPVHIHLLKQIPIGAGLGGGSADGAAMLMLLNKQFQLGLDTHKLLDHAARLGSDCPFFILDKPCLAAGRGERLEPIALDLSGYSFVIVAPGVHISTAQAFALCTPEESGIPGKKESGAPGKKESGMPGKKESGMRGMKESEMPGKKENGAPEETRIRSGQSIKDIIRQPIDTWARELRNDFEASVLGLYPSLRPIKEQLYAAGAIYAAMTGSGSSFFGIFKKDNFPSLTFDPDFDMILLT